MNWIFRVELVDLDAPVGRQLRHHLEVPLHGRTQRDQLVPLNLVELAPDPVTRMRAAFEGYRLELHIRTAPPFPADGMPASSHANTLKGST